MCRHAGTGVTMPDMALFGMVWLLRVRAEMRKCAKCRREEARWLQQQQPPEEAELPVAAPPIFTVESAAQVDNTAPPPPPPKPKTPRPRTFCEVHGYRQKRGNIISNNYFSLYFVWVRSYINLT